MSSIPIRNFNFAESNTLASTKPSEVDTFVILFCIFNPLKATLFFLLCHIFLADKVQICDCIGFQNWTVWLYVLTGLKTKHRGQFRGLYCKTLWICNLRKSDKF